MAEHLIDAQGVRWRSDGARKSDPWSRQLRQLAFANPAAADVMLERLFTAELEWPLLEPRFNEFDPDVAAELAQLHDILTRPLEDLRSIDWRSYIPAQR